MDRSESRQRIKELEQEIADLRAMFPKRSPLADIGANHRRKVYFIENRRNPSAERARCCEQTFNQISLVARLACFENNKERLAKDNKRKSPAQMSDSEYERLLSSIEAIIDVLYETTLKNIEEEPE